MKKKLPTKYRQVTCPLECKIYVIDTEEKCCPCCGEYLSESGLLSGHYVYEEDISNG